MNIILYGFPYSGKTHLGKKIAKEKKCPFIDTDHLIENLFFKRHHVPLSCKQIAKEKGNAFFRKLEKEVIDRLHPQDAVIAVGGGAVLEPENVEKLKQLGKLFYLEISKETLKARLFNHELPSYLDPDEPVESFENMYFARKKIYETISSLRISPNLSEDEVLDLIDTHGQ